MSDRLDIFRDVIGESWPSETAFNPIDTETIKNKLIQDTREMIGEDAALRLSNKLNNDQCTCLPCDYCDQQSAESRGCDNCLDSIINCTIHPHPKLARLFRPGQP